jgi:hypothetical protein
VPVLPANANAQWIFPEHLLDYPSSARLRDVFGLDDDLVSSLGHHSCLTLLFDLRSRRLARAVAAGASAELPDPEQCVVLDYEHALALRNGLDNVPDETENGCLVRRAVPGDECPTAVGKRFEDATERGCEHGGVFNE